MTDSTPEDGYGAYGVGKGTEAVVELVDSVPYLDWLDCEK